MGENIPVAKYLELEAIGSPAFLRVENATKPVYKPRPAPQMRYPDMHRTFLESLGHGEWNAAIMDGNLDPLPRRRNFIRHATAILHEADGFRPINCKEAFRGGKSSTQPSGGTSV